jgi:preprotein translocase subunit SecF
LIRSSWGRLRDLFKAAQAISDYRRNSSGVITDISLIQTQDVSAELLDKLKAYFAEGTFAVISADVVGAVVGKDLRNRAIYVTLAALAGMLVYIAFRFEWIYGVAAVLAVFHDVMVTLGIFALFQWEISLTVIAALLTLVGYSNERHHRHIRPHTREQPAASKGKPRPAQATRSTRLLSRTIITSGLTFLSVVAIVLFGGEVLRILRCLTIGIIVGCYSTVAVASPVMLWWEYMTGAKRVAEGTVETKARAAERTSRPSVCGPGTKLERVVSNWLKV